MPLPIDNKLSIFYSNCMPEISASSLLYEKSREMIIRRTKCDAGVQTLPAKRSSALPEEECSRKAFQ